MLRVCASNSCGVPTLHIPHIPHQLTNQPLIQSTSAVPCKFSMSSNCATPTSLPTPLLINLRHGDKKGSEQSLPKAPSPPPPLLFKNRQSDGRIENCSKFAQKKKQLISLPAVPIEQQQQHDEASASSSASCVALREARRKICAYNKLPK